MHRKSGFDYTCGVLLAVICLATVHNAVRGADTPTVSVGLGKQLFVDDHIIAKKSGVTRELGTVKKANGGKPIFPDGRFYGTVLHDEGRFKMWYRLPSGKTYGYAEATDGLHFKKKAEISGIDYSGDVNMSVMIDPHETDPAHRYKAAFDALPGAGAGLAHSADGIHWQAYNGGKAVTYRAADTYNFITWDAAARTYRLFTRTDYGQGGGPFAGTVARDFEVRGTRSMTNPDIKADPTAWKLVRHWHFNREGPQEYKRRQIYALTDWIYHGVHFALLSVYEWPSDFSEGGPDLHKRHERDVMTFYIGTSRDGDRWDLSWVYAGKPIIPRGGDGTFDKDLLMPPSSIVTHNDRHWLYYGGANERHGDPSLSFPRTHKIGLATLRLDGFVCLQADKQPGTVLTKPFQLTGSRLEINTDASGGKLAIEVLNQTGQIVAKSQPITGDVLHGQVKWSTGDPADLRDQTIQLRFRLRNAKLYSFQWH